MKSPGAFSVLVRGGALGLLLAIGFLLPCLGGAAVPARLDLAAFFWPMKSYTAARWASGSPPLWNPLSGCGEPWLAQLQTGVFYPPDLAFLLRWPWGPLAGLAFHLVVAASGMALWLSELGLSRVSALAGSVVFAGGGAFASLAPVYNNFCAASFLPWIFAGALQAVRGKGVLGLALPAALAFLSGEPAIAALGAVSGSAVALATAAEEKAPPAPPPRRRIAALAGALLLAVGLTAAAGLPFGEWLVGSGRFTDTGRGEALARPVRSSDLSDLILPPSVGLTRQGRADRGGYLVTLALGPLAFLLASGCLAGLPARPRLLAALFLLGVLGLLLSLGPAGRLVPVLYDTGLWRGLRFPARWFILAHFSLATAAGAGLEGWRTGVFWRRYPRAREEAEPWLLEVEPPGALPRGVPLIPVLLFGAAAGLLLVRGLQERGRLAADGTLRGGLAFGVAAVAAVALAAGRLRREPARSGVLVLALLALPAPFFAGESFAAAPAEPLGKPPRIVADLPAPGRGRIFAAVSDPRLLSKWTTPAGRWGPETALLAHEALAGYTNLTAGLSSANSPSPIINPHLDRLLAAPAPTGNAAALLSLADVRFLVTPFPPSFPGARLSREAGGVARYELPAPAGRAFFVREVREASDEAALLAIRRAGFEAGRVAFVPPPGRSLPPSQPDGPAFSVVRFLSDEPERTRILLTVSDPGLLVLTRSFDRGWEARLDGTAVPVLRVDVAFLGIGVPKGEHQLEVLYRPLSFRAGAIVSGLSALVALGLLLAGSPPPGGRR